MTNKVHNPTDLAVALKAAFRAKVPSVVAEIIGIPSNSAIQSTYGQSCVFNALTNSVYVITALRCEEEVTSLMYLSRLYMFYTAVTLQPDVNISLQEFNAFTQLAESYLEVNPAMEPEEAYSHLQENLAILADMCNNSPRLSITGYISTLKNIGLWLNVFLILTDIDEVDLILCKDNYILDLPAVKAETDLVSEGGDCD